MNERGKYGEQPRGSGGAGNASGSITPWILGSVGLAIAGLTVVMTQAAVKRPRLSDHEREVRAWEAEFPGLPWYADQVKDSRQLDMWERARDHWERKT